MDLIELAKSSGLILDGGMGTMLIMAGLTGGRVSEYWNLENPSVIEKIHQAYIDAGADVITTNTFGASSLKLKKAGLEDQAESINRKAVELARKAAKDRFVAGDIGPTGDLMAPFGPVSIEQAFDSFAGQAACLARSGVDLFLIETMFDVQECLAAVKGVRSVSDLPIFATLTFRKTARGFATIMGNKVSESLEALQDAGAVAVGANCTLGSDDMVGLAEEIRAAIQGLTIVQPNAGSPQTRGADICYPEDSDYFSDRIVKIKALGIEIVGGCCGTTPEYIRKIRQKIQPAT